MRLLNQTVGGIARQDGAIMNDRWDWSVIGQICLGGYCISIKNPVTELILNSKLNLYLNHVVSSWNHVLVYRFFRVETQMYRM